MLGTATIRQASQVSPFDDPDYTRSQIVQIIGFARRFLGNLPACLACHFHGRLETKRAPPHLLSLAPSLPLSLFLERPVPVPVGAIERRELQ